MTTFAIGDIHGCLDALNTVVSAAEIKPQDTIVLLGDYVDRGPDSKGVIDWVLQHQSQFNLITLRGNHEVMMLNAREDTERLFMWQHFGGEETLYSYGVKDGTDWMECIPQSHWQFIENTLPYFETESHIFVHAGVSPKTSLEDQNDAALYWKKYLKPKSHRSKKTVVCGHTAQSSGEISDFEHTVCIDTYAYGGQWLTCLDVDSGQYWQANQQRESRKNVRQ